MAEIPVEKKSGIPWWVWLLLALLIAALLWWLLDDGDEPEQVAAAPYEEVAAPADAGAAPIAPVDADATAGSTTADAAAGAASPGVIRDLSAVRGADASGEIVGRQVELSSVPVLEMVSDAGFYIGSSPADRVYVLLNEQETPNQPGEGRVNVNKGQTIDLSGAVRSAADVPAGLFLPQGVERYIWAQRVTIR